MNTNTGAFLMLKKAKLFVFLIALTSPSLHAKTITAASSDYTDVNNAVASANAYDIVQIPQVRLHGTVHSRLRSRSFYWAQVLTKR